MILCVAANPSVDRLFTVERLVPGSIHRPAEFLQVPGGKGLNVARAAATLGGDVRAAALLGGHAGRWIAQELAAESVPLDAIWAAAETRSSLSVSGTALIRVLAPLVNPPVTRRSAIPSRRSIPIERSRSGVSTSPSV